MDTRKAAPKKKSVAPSTPGRRRLSELSIPQQFGWLVFALAVVLYVVEVLWSAWVCDDAYITFRTVDNFVNGLGLRWNAFERVQTYTHPLWMLLSSAVYFFSNEAFLTSIFLSTAVSLAAVLVLGLRVARSFGVAALAVGAVLLSKSFVDYSTSGLENPLTHLLAGIFVFVYSRFENDSKGIFYLSMVSGLCMLNRMDTALLVLPTLGVACYKVRTRGALYALVLGLVPLLLWLCFSLFYYGFVFPNTAYAKLNTGLDRTDLLVQGLYYLWSTVRIDPLTIAAMVAVWVAIPVLKAYRVIPLGAGILLYVGYVVYIGGDFMSGRFFSAPFFLAICVFACFLPTLGKPGFLLICALVAVVGITPDRSPIRFADQLERLKDHHKVEDERAFYMSCASLHAMGPSREIPDCVLAVKGREAREAGIELKVRGSVGYYGYFAGPRARIIDRFAISDPLLARLPMERYDNWRIGHFRRKIPEGYIETVQTGSNRIRDEALAEYYDKLCALTQGDPLDPSRITEIWRLNTGQYNHLIDREKYSAPKGETR